MNLVSDHIWLVLTYLVRYIECLWNLLNRRGILKKERNFLHIFYNIIVSNYMDRLGRNAIM